MRELRRGLLSGAGVLVICLEKHISVLLVSEPLNHASLKTGTTKPKLLGAGGVALRQGCSRWCAGSPRTLLSEGSLLCLIVLLTLVIEGKSMQPTPPPSPLALGLPLHMFCPPWVHPLSPPEDAKNILAASLEEPTAFSDPLGSPPSHGHSGYAVPSEGQFLFVF